jgi:hypothetical protein
VSKRARLGTAWVDYNNKERVERTKEQEAQKSRKHKRAGSTKEQEAQRAGSTKTYT